MAYGSVALASSGWQFVLEPSKPVLASSAHTSIYLEFPFITNLLIRCVHCTRTLSKHSSSGSSPRHNTHSRRVCSPSEPVSILRALSPASACTHEGRFRHLCKSRSMGPAGSHWCPACTRHGSGWRGTCLLQTMQPGAIADPGARGAPAVLRPGCGHLSQKCHSLVRTKAPKYLPFER